MTESLRCTFLERTRVERCYRRKGKPYFVWRTGYYVINDEGSKIYPPVLWREAKALVKELYGPKRKTQIVDKV